MGTLVSFLSQSQKKMTDNNDSSSTPMKLEKFSLNVHDIIIKSQLEHGLKQNDYQSYRLYCARRLARLRKAAKAKLATKNGKYVGLKIESEIVSNENHLLIALMLTERAWSYGMQLKDDIQEARDDGNDEKPIDRWTLHMKSRLRKAVSYANQFLNLIKNHGTEQTLVEAEAYVAFINGSLNIATNDWKNALKNYSKTSSILNQLITIKQSIGLQRRLNDTQILVEFCAHRLTSTGIDPKSITSDLSSSPQLKKALENAKILAKEAENSSNNSTNISYRNISLSFQLPKIDSKLKDCLELENKLNSNQNENNLENRLEQFETLIVAYNSLLNAIKVEQKKPDSNPKLSLLKRAIQERRCKQQIERYTHQIDALSVGDTAGSATSSSDTATSSLHTLTSLCSSLTLASANLGASATEDELNGTPADRDTITLAASITAEWTAVKAFALARLKEKQSLYAEAGALLQRANELIDEALSHQSKSKRLPKLKTSVTHALSTLRARAFLTNQKQSNVELQSFGKGGEALLSSTSSFESGVNAAIKNTLTSLRPHITAVPMKPQQFDIASSGVQFDSVAQRTRSQSGWFGGLF